MTDGERATEARCASWCFFGMALVMVGCEVGQSIAAGRFFGGFAMIAGLFWVSWALMQILYRKGGTG